MFRSRLELIQYFIHRLTGRPMDKCEQEALKHENKPFILRNTCD